MHNMSKNHPTNLWLSCAQTSGRIVYRESFIHQDRVAILNTVQSWSIYTTRLAHFLYSVFLSKKHRFTSVITTFFHTIHSTYNYIPFGQKNTFIMRVWNNEEAV